VDIQTELHDFLQLIIQDKHKGTAHASEHIGPGSLEEGLATFITGDLPPAVHGATVHDVRSFASRLHHHTTADGIEGVGNETGAGSHSLSDRPADNNVCILGIWQHTLGCVINTKVGSSVDDDSLHRHTEALVQALEAVRLEDGGQAVAEPTELTLSGLANVGSKACSGEVKGVDKAEGGGTGSTAGGQVAGEVPPELILIYAVEEDLLVLILECKVESLGREVSDDVSQVPSPEGNEALFLGDTNDAVHDALVLLGSRDLFAGMLYLEKKLHSLNRSNSCLGDGSGYAASQEVLGERNGRFTHF